MKTCKKVSQTRCSPHKGEMDEGCEISIKNRCIIKKSKKKITSEKKIFVVEKKNKYFILKGDETKSIKEELKNFKGTWNKSFGGWTFTNNYLEKVINKLKKLYENIQIDIIEKKTNTKNKSCKKVSDTRCSPHTGEMDNECELSEKNRCIKKKISHKKQSSSKSVEKDSKFPPKVSSNNVVPLNKKPSTSLIHYLLEFKNDKSNKFYDIKLNDDNSVTIIWGKINAKGRKKILEFKNKEEAHNFIFKQIKEKKKKGYLEIKNNNSTDSEKIVSGNGITDISDNLLIEMIINLSDTERGIFCQSNQKISELCRNEEIWESLVQKKFGIYDKGEFNSWLIFYKYLMTPNFYDISEYIDAFGNNMKYPYNITLMSYISEDLQQINSKFDLNLSAQEIWDIGGGLFEDWRYPDVVVEEYKKETTDKILSGRSDIVKEEFIKDITSLYPNWVKGYTEDKNIEKRMDYILSQMPQLKDGDIVFTHDSYESRPEYSFYYVDNGDLKHTAEWFYGLNWAIEGGDYEEELKTKTGKEVLVEDFKSILPEKFRKFNYDPVFETIMVWDQDKKHRMFVDTWEYWEEKKIHNETKPKFN